MGFDFTMVSSFDVFDTLVARRWMTSDPIWGGLENHHRLPGFAAARRSADNGARSLYEIYAILVAQGLISEAQEATLLREEVEAEIKQAIPVKANLDQVQHGDWLITDTYLPANMVMQILRAAGLKKQVSIYQSNAGKRLGTFWRMVAAAPPEKHLGDNPHSDVQQASAQGIQAELYAGTGFSQVEQSLFSNGFRVLSFLMREVRLRHDSGTLFNIACSLNLPLLMLAAEIVHRRFGNRNLVFLGRDCFLLHRLYEAYYGHGHYIPFSRVAVYKDPVAAAGYLRELSPLNPVYIDGSSTGATWQYLDQYYPGIEIMVLIHFDDYKYTAKRPVPPPGFSYISLSSAIRYEAQPGRFALEALNCADHGHVYEIRQQGDRFYQAMFAEFEVQLDDMEIIHSPVNAAVAQASSYRAALRAELAAMPEPVLIKVFQELAKAINTRDDLFDAIKGYLDNEGKYFYQDVMTLVRDRNLK